MSLALGAVEVSGRKRQVPIINRDELSAWAQGLGTPHQLGVLGPPQWTLVANIGKGAGLFLGIAQRIMGARPYATELSGCTARVEDVVAVSVRGR